MTKGTEQKFQTFTTEVSMFIASMYGGDDSGSESKTQILDAIQSTKSLAGAAVAV